MAELQGLIIAAHGRHYLAQGEGKLYQCVTRGKKSDVATGDRVRIKITSEDQGVIEAILPRASLLYRSDQYKSKLLAANVTQLFIVVATEPGFTDDLVSRALVAANAAGIKAHLLLNKIDLTDGLRATFGSGDIVHLRPSGNAPELRCYAEAAEARDAEQLCEACLARISRQLGD